MKGEGVPFDYSKPVMAARLGALAVLALVAGCTTKPKPPPGIVPSVEVGAPLKSDAWKSVATAADEDRIARLGLAWQEALAEARKSNEGDIRKEGGAAPAARRPAAAGPDAGQLQLPPDQARQGDGEEQAVRELQTVLLLRRGRG